MNKKAQLGTAVMFVMVTIVMIYLWVYLVHPIIQASIPNLITTYSITGISAFALQNLSLFFFITLFLFVIGFAAFYRRQQTARFAR